MSKNSLAVSVASFDDLDATKCGRLLIRSTNTVTASKPRGVRGSWTMKSKETLPHRRGEGSSTCGEVRGGRLDGFVRWHGSQPWTYRLTSRTLDFQAKSLSLSRVLVTPKCPPVGASCANSRTRRTWERGTQRAPSFVRRVPLESIW